jgi:hypothetical protein
MSLSATATSARFLDFPLATILSYKFSHCGLHIHAVKLHINSLVRTVGLPRLDISQRFLRPVKELISKEFSPQKADRFLTIKKPKIHWRLR